MRYRRTVVETQLRNSFPFKSEEELQTIAKKSYANLGDIIVESIKGFTMSENDFRKRYIFTNPELSNQYTARGQSVILSAAHYNNWEWIITGQSLFFKHQALGIGTPLTSKFWDKKLNELRARFGMVILNSKTVKAYFEKLGSKPVATLILSDQSPGDSTKSYWMSFLNQQSN